MAKKNKLTDIEKLVLRRLELDARASFSNIAKKIRKSQQRVSYVVNSLIEKEIITGFYALIDYSKLDALNFRVYFKVTYIGEDKFHELIEYLKKEPYTLWVATCGGRYDLICSFLTLNPSQLNKILRRIIGKFPHQLRDYTVLTTIVIRRFGRKYLYTNLTNFQEIIIGGDREPEDIETTDMNILNQISEDARISSVNAGNILSLTPKTVIKRIKNLRQRDIIKGFKPLLDIRKMGYISTLVLIRYHNISPELENKFISYLKAQPNIVNIVKTLGEWDIEIEIETENQPEFRKIEMDIREKFALMIHNIESFPLYRTYKRNFFPKFLVENSSQ